MRVLLVTDSYPPIIGGATRAAQQLGRQLRLRGHDVVVATVWQRDQPGLEDDDGVQVHRLRGAVSRVEALSADPSRYTPPPFPDPELAWRLRSLLKSARPDVVHTYGWLTYSLLPALTATRIPLVLAMRDSGNACAVRTLIRQGRERGSVCSGPAWGKCHECSGAYYGEPKGAVAATSVLAGRRPLSARADAIHTTSRFTEAMVRSDILRARDVPMEVIPDFREDELSGAPAPAIMARLPSDPYILFVGAFRRVKGDEVLIEAHRRLANAPPLVMIGSQSADGSPAFPPGVTPLFDVPHDTVLAAWDRALFGAMPSVVPEALGNVVHEAMSRGKAVIGTRPGGHEDMIVEGETGLLVPSGDVDALAEAMRRLLADPSSTARMGAAGCERAALFTPTYVVPRIERLYEQAIAHQAQRRGQSGSQRRSGPQQPDGGDRSTEGVRRDEGHRDAVGDHAGQDLDQQRER